MKITTEMIGSEARKNPAGRVDEDNQPFLLTWKSSVSGRRQSSSYRTKSEAIRDARAMESEGTKDIELSKYSRSLGAVPIEWRKPEARKVSGNPAKKQKLPWVAHEPGRGSNNFLVWFDSKSDATKYAQKLADKFGKPFAVSRMTSKPFPEWEFKK